MSVSVTFSGHQSPALHRRFWRKRRTHTRPQRKNDPAARCLWLHCYRHSSWNAADTGRIVYQQILLRLWVLHISVVVFRVILSLHQQRCLISGISHYFCLMLLSSFSAAAFLTFGTDFPSPKAKKLKPIGEQTNKRKLLKLASPALRSICPWPTFLSLPPAWEVFAGSRRKASVLTLRTAEAALKVRRMCTVKCPTIKGEHPLKLAWRVTM